MGSVHSLRSCFTAAALGAASCFAQAQGFAADYRLAPALSLGGAPGAGLSLQAGRNWFGQVDVGGTAGDTVAFAGGYRWANGQALSLQLSRGHGPGQRLGLSLNYDWPRYFVRFSYDQGAVLPLPQPQDSLRFSAGVRF